MAKNSFLTALLVFVAVLGAEAQKNKVYKADTIVDGKGNAIVNVYSAQTVTIHDFEMSLAGAGSLVCEDLHADHVELGVAGSGSIVIEAGTVKKPTFPWPARVRWRRAASWSRWITTSRDVAVSIIMAMSR